MMRLENRKNFKYLIEDKRRSFGKNRIYCPLRDHSTTDYVLPEASALAFSADFLSDSRHDSG